MADWNEQLSSVTLTYSSADSPVFVASTSFDLTGQVSPGMRLRLYQPTDGLKYFIVVAVSSTTVTLYGGTDYDLDNEAISFPVFSTAKAPFGFPLNPAKWTVELKSTSTVSQGTASANTWYNLGSLSLDIPIGCWKVSWSGTMDCTRAGVTDVDQWTTLSTSNNSESDNDFTVAIYLSGANATLETMQGVFREKYLTLTSKTTYYLVAKTGIANTNINITGGRAPTIVRAICAYL